MIKYAILGASGHGKVVADALFQMTNIKDIIFFDDAYPSAKNIGCWSIEGNTQDLIRRQSEFHGAVVAIGNNFIRYAKQLDLVLNGVKIISVVHPKAVVSPFATIDAGTVILAGAIVNSDASVAAACIINSNAVVEHDCKLSEAVHISPGANLGGGVVIGQHAWVGIGSCVRQMVRVGNNVIIGAGSVVVKDVVDNITVVGCPAKAMR